MRPLTLKASGMKAVILAGGFGSRLPEETHLKPRPMVEIGERPILWLLMKLSTCDGITVFIICLGYKGYVIKQYFANNFLHTSDMPFDMPDKRMEVHEKHAEPRQVTLLDTGKHPVTSARLARVKRYLADENALVFACGDRMTDIDLSARLHFHRQHGKLAGFRQSVDTLREKLLLETVWARNEATWKSW